MNIFNTSQRRNRLSLLIVPMLLVLGLGLGGCSNDPVAPHEDPPALSGSDVASQAGFVAMSVGIIGPQTVEFGAKAEENPYRHTFTSPVAGSVYLSYFTGGPEGTPVEPGAADYVNLYTAAGEPVIITVGVEGAAGSISLALDVTADLDRDANPDTATLGGGGTFASGPYTASFEFDELLIMKGASYPAGGSMIFSSAGRTATVIFNGTNMAALELSSGATYLVNLENGTATEVGLPPLP